MNTLRTAAQQALEFIRWSQYVPCQSEAFPEPPSTAPQVEAALRAALAEPVPDSKHATIAEWSADKQRKPLTEEEIDSIWDSEKAFADIYAIVRAVERAHGIMP